VHHEDGRQPGNEPEAPVERAQGPWDVVIAGTRDPDLGETPIGEESRQRPLGEQPQVPGDEGARPAVHPAQADLGEDRLDAREHEAAVEPRGQVRGGKQQMAAGTKDAVELGEAAVGVDEMLDDLAEDDDVDAAGGERQTRVQRPAHQPETALGRLFERPLRPVHADDVMAAQLAGPGGRQLGAHPVATADVGDAQRAVRRTEDVVEQEEQPAGAQLPGSHGHARGLVEVAQSRAHVLTAGRATVHPRAPFWFARPTPAASRPLGYRRVGHLGRPHYPFGCHRRRVRLSSRSTKPLAVTRSRSLTLAHARECSLAPSRAGTLGDREVPERPGTIRLSTEELMSIWNEISPMWNLWTMAGFS
jgi:hypothetical protein